MRHIRRIHREEGPHGLRNRWARASRAARWGVIGFVLLLTGARLALPYLIERDVNRKLNRTPGYAGRIGTVTVHLWRGAYKIHNISIQKTGGRVPVPLFSTRVMDLSVQWRELFRGSVVGSVSLERPEINLVEGPTPELSETGKEGDWRKTVESLFPLRINEFKIDDGQARFRNFYKSRPVDIYVTNLFCVATNLSNARDLLQKLPAGLTAKGRTLGDGLFSVKMRLDLLATAPTFEMDATVTNMDLVALNDFLRAYGKLDVERGTFGLVTSVASVQGTYEGTVKVFFDNLKMWAWDKERKKNILQIFWEAVAGTLAAGFKNHPHDRLAAKIPISGTFTNSSVGVLSAAGSLLHNAFIRVLLPTIEKPARIEELREKVKEKEGGEMVRTNTFKGHSSVAAPPLSSLDQSDSTNREE